jgi:hypothetical protein
LLSKTPFTLHPFSPDSLCPALQSLQITGIVERQQEQLTVQFELQGAIASILLADYSPSPQRRDHLWQHTCFEFFLGIPDSPRYWEVNLAPSGDWNIYRFSNYRHGMAPELAYTELPLRLDHPRPDRLQVQVSLNLGAMVTTGQPLDLGVTMVVLDTSQTQSYWALTHPAVEADFHHRDGFMIRV